MTVVWIVFAVIFCFAGSVLATVGALFQVFIDDTKEALYSFGWSLLSYAFFGICMWAVLS